MIQRHPLLIEGIEAAKAGDKARAQRLLAQAIRRNPDSIEAWLWLSGTFDTPQGRAFCLEKVLSIDPTNRAAQRGLAALGAGRHQPTPHCPPPVPAICPGDRPPTEQVAPADPQPGQAADGQSQPARSTRTEANGSCPAPAARHDRLWSQPHFWQAVVICLGVIALALAGVLAYDAIKRPTGDELVAAGPAGHGSIAPPTAHAAPHLYIYTPADRHAHPYRHGHAGPNANLYRDAHAQPDAHCDPDADSSARPPQRERGARRHVDASGPLCAPPVWDPRLTALGVRLEPAAVPPGVDYWRLVEARWADGQESGGKHTIYVEVLDPRGNRVVGQPVIFEWSSGSLTLAVENRPAPDWGVNFPMFATLGSYSARVGVESSDRVVGMGMGTIEDPDFTVHTCFYLTFRWTQR